MLTSITSSFYVYEGKYTGDKIFATDLDGTLIRTRKSRFPKDENDYAFLPNCIKTLKNYVNKGFTIVIFTNQKRLPNVMINKINNVLTDLINEGIDPWIFVSTKDDKYRKPNIGMWEYFVVKFNHDINLKQSFYVGDASGRPEDHSDSDLKFAEQISLKFNENPLSFLDSGLSIESLKFYVPEKIFSNDVIDIPDYQSMFIAVGNQGSGKSSYYKNHLEPLRWFHANQDKIGTYAKVLKEIEKALKEGQSVYVDATNPSFSKRQDYIKLAIKYQIPTLIIYFVRDGHGFNQLRSENRVPEIAYSIYYKNLEEPTEELDGVPVIEYF